MEFNEEFYRKICRLMMIGTADAKTELYKMYEEVKGHYDKMGWKRFPFEGLEQTATTKSQECSRASVIQSVHTTDVISPISDDSSDPVSSSGTEAPPPPKKRIKTIPTDEEQELKVLGGKPTTGKVNEIIPIKSTPKFAMLKSETPQASPNRECTICGDTVISDNNSFANCTECLQSYHQLCHDPPIKSEELNDPRFIFCCSYCAKKRHNFLKSSSPVLQPPPPPSTKIKETKKRTHDTSADKSTLFTKNNDKIVESNSKGKTEIASMAEAFLAKHKNKNNKGGVVLPSNAAIAARTLGSPTNPLTGLAKLAAQTNNSGLVGLGKLTASPNASSVVPSSVNVKTVASNATPMQSANQRLLAMKKKAKLSK